jgi:hypothetical protein
MERDAGNSYPTGDGLEAGPMEQLLDSSITYRIAVRPHQLLKTRHSIRAAYGPQRLQAHAAHKHVNMIMRYIDVNDANLRLTIQPADPIHVQRIKGQAQRFQLSVSNRLRQTVGVGS